MKIIKNGNYIPQWVGRELDCKKCKTIWKLEKGDDIRYNYYEPDIAIVYCPTCNQRRTFADYSLWD